MNRVPWFEPKKEFDYKVSVSTHLSFYFGGAFTPSLAVNGTLSERERNVGHELQWKTIFSLFERSFGYCLFVKHLYVRPLRNRLIRLISTIAAEVTCSMEQTRGQIDGMLVRLTCQCGANSPTGQQWAKYTTGRRTKPQNISKTYFCSLNKLKRCNNRGMICNNTLVFHTSVSSYKQHFVIFARHFSQACGFFFHSNMLQV